MPLEYDENLDNSFKEYIKKLKEKDILFEYKVEFGKLLMIPEEQFTDEQRKRFEELERILKEGIE